VVSTLADYVAREATTRAVAAAWTAPHQFGGALLGEHLASCWRSAGQSPSACKRLGFQRSYSLVVLQLYLSIL
jgi:hypothetical protein